MTTDITPQFNYLPSKDKIQTSEPEIGIGQNVGGMAANSQELSQGKVRIQGVAERILIGDATAPLTGTGVFIGSDQAATVGYDFRAGNPSGNYIHWDESAGTLTIVGTLTATAGTIGGWTINSTSIFTGTEDHSGYTANAGDITLYSDGANASIHAFNFYIDNTGKFFSTSGSLSGVSITSIPNDASTDISLLEATHDLVFSVTDSDTIAWSSGTIVLSNGRTFSISSGNTGNMSALTYIYLDPAVSTTVLQTTTTYSTALSANKRLIGTAQNNTVTASYIPYGPGQPLIDGANIGALSIVAGNIAASTITAGKLSVSQLSAITADLGSITAGSITINSGVASISSAGAAVFKSIQVGGSTVQYTLNDSGIYSYGDGSDGSATLDGSATPSGMTKSGSDYTMTRDVYYTDMTMSTGTTLNPAGYRIFGTGTLTLNGTAIIKRNGNNGSNGGNGQVSTPKPGGAGGAALSDGYLKGSVAGATGGTGGPGTSGVAVAGGNSSGTATSNSIGLDGANGGSGGAGGSGTAGGTSTGGTATQSNVKLIANWHLATLLDVSSSGSTVKFDNSAGSAGGGGGSSSNGSGGDSGGGGSGGGAGSSGGIVAIYFRAIIIGASATISANGGNGGNGGNGQNGLSGTSGGGGGGGGGAGGNGGEVILVYNTLSNSGSITASGGTGGTAGTFGTGISGGPNGVAGSNGSNGTDGHVRQFNLSL